MPEFSKGLFWDCDVAELNVETHRRFIIHRVLTRGTWDDWKLLKSLYSWEAMKDEAVRMRKLDPRTLAFCCTIFDLPKEAFRCTSSQPS